MSGLTWNLSVTGLKCLSDARVTSLPGYSPPNQLPTENSPCGDKVPVVVFISKELSSPSVSDLGHMLHSGCMVNFECGLYHTASCENHRAECMQAPHIGSLGVRTWSLICQGCHCKVLGALVLEYGHLFARGAIVK